MKKLLFVLFALLPLLMNGQVVSTSVENYSGKVYKESKLDVKPEFSDGIAAFWKHVNSNVIIPEIEEHGTFVTKVSFVIETDGNMTNFEILKDPGYGLANEVVRVLKTIKKKWSPGIKKNQTVRSLFVLPVTITIKG